MARKNYDIDIDNAGDGRDSGSHKGLIFVFTLILVAILGIAVWIFFFSDRGFNLSSHNPADDLSAPTEGYETLEFVGVSFDEVSLTMEVGERQHIRAKFQLEPGSHIDTRSLKMVWKSENPQVVRVDKYGELWARSEGTARISAYIDDERIDSNTAYCMVKVVKAGTQQDYPRLKENPDSAGTVKVNGSESSADEKPAVTTGTETKHETKSDTKQSTGKTDTKSKPAGDDDAVRDKVRRRLSGN